MTVRLSLVIAITVLASSIAACGESRKASQKPAVKENAEVFTECSLAGEKECSKKAQEAEKPATPAERVASEAGFRAYAECKAAEGSACARKGAEAEATKQAAQLDEAKKAGEAEAAAEARHPNQTGKSAEESARKAAEQSPRVKVPNEAAEVARENDETKKAAEAQCGRHLSDGQIEQVADGGGCPQ